MIMMPPVASTRAFAIRRFLEDRARGRATPGDARDMLAELRMIGDVANLERLSRALAGHDAPAE